MTDEFTKTFASLRGVMERHLGPLVVSTDTPARYTLVGTKPSPYPQHKGALEYQGEMFVNWCPALGTVLAIRRSSSRCRPT